MSPDSSETSTSARVSGLTTPLAIVIAGALIAVAIFAGGRGNAPTSNTAQVTNTTAGTAVPTVAAEIKIRDVSTSDHIRGSQNAKVTLVEYSDIECPFCKRFHPTVQKVMEEYPNDVRWVYRHFPLEAIHPNARISANAVECADDQGKFWELLDYLFTNTTTGADLTQDKLITHAQAAGVPNIATFTSCLNAKTHDKVVADDMTDAQAAGARGTPYTILVGPNGQKVPISGAQAFESVKAQIDTLLEK